MEQIADRYRTSNENFHAIKAVGLLALFDRGRLYEGEMLCVPAAPSAVALRLLSRTRMDQLYALQAQDKFDPVIYREYTAEELIDASDMIESRRGHCKPTLRL